MKAKFIYEAIKHLKPRTGPEIEEYLEKVKNFKPDGYLQLSNFGGLEIQIIPSGDGVLYRFNYGEGELYDIKEAEIEWSSDEESKPYFMAYDIPYYLEDFMRIELIKLLKIY